MSTPRVCILHVGGTIGMVDTPHGLAPQSGQLQRHLVTMPELSRADFPRVHVEPLEPLQDSADMTPADWLRIAQAIVERDREFDGFVVLHGTDTMVHTASALSFLLPGLRKPIVLTGSQLPLAHPRSDGREHIITAVVLAGTQPIPEVGIYFGARLLRGNRARKIDNRGFMAFDSGNLAPLATVGVDIRIAAHLVRAPGVGVPAKVELPIEPRVTALRVFPGLSRPLVEAMLRAQGVVLETYGAGTFPLGNPELLAAVAAATGGDPPTIVVNCSQCHGGVVRQDLYQSSRALAAVGVLSGHDMTPEAALTKLYVLLAQGLPSQQVRDAMVRDLAGELDPTGP